MVPRRASATLGAVAAPVSSERAVLTVTVRWAGATPLITVSHTGEDLPIAPGLNTTDRAAASSLIERWLEVVTDGSRRGGNSPGDPPLG